MKRIQLWLFLCTILLLSIPTAVNAFNGGSCGVNVYWTFDDSTLYIKGSGNMDDFKNKNNIPWHEYEEKIINVNIEEGITSIGDLAFFECSSLKSVIMPEGVTRIGHHAFAQCNNLKIIMLPSTINNINAYAFAGTGLTELVLPSSVQTIGDATFYKCVNLKNINIPDKVKVLPNSLFLGCENLVNVTLTEGLLEIANLAFSDCSKLYTIKIPMSVTNIDTFAFDKCKSLENILLPPGITQIKQGTFMFCSNLTKLVIPQGVDSIDGGAFEGCTNLQQISIPNTVSKINSYAFQKCNIVDIYYGGTIEEWMRAIGTTGNNANLTNTKIHYDQYVSHLISVIINGDMLSLEQPPSIINGRTLVPLRAIFEALGATVEWDGVTQTITSTIDSTTIKLTIGNNILYKNGIAVALDVPAQLINGYTMVPVRAVAEAFGADVNWDDTTQTVYITTKGNTYTVNTIPQIKYDGYDANFADFNGMYIDSFSHSTNGDGKENVKFDVYNTQYIYGIVEIYNANNELTDVAIIDKMSNSTSIKGVLIDDTGSLIKDLWNGTALTYRQASGYSKKTSISIDIPKGGYIKITNDMHESFIASAVNLADMVFSAKSTFSTLNGFNSDTSKEFVYELSAKLVKEAAFSEMVKNPTKYTDKLLKKVGKELYMNSESIGGFLETVSKNLDELADGKLTELIFSTAANCGISIAEGTFKALAGPAGVALKAIFTINSVSDTLVEMNDGLVCLNQGSIKIKTV